MRSVLRRRAALRDVLFVLGYESDRDLCTGANSLDPRVALPFTFFLSAGRSWCSADGKPLPACLLPAAAQCNVTIIGDRRTSGCSVCKPDDPTFCLKVRLFVRAENCHYVLLKAFPRPALSPVQCEGHCNPYGCTGYYVTREGECSECPIGAAACEDLTGLPTKCRDGYGLVAGECRSCFNEKHNGTECRQCNGAALSCWERGR